MRILALEPYYGGSHRAFLDGWIAHSRHDWTLLTFPAHKWKWRMRHSAISFADQLHASEEAKGQFELVFASDMLNLAEFRGLAPHEIAQLPAVVYFHENQLTYPVRHSEERDLHFGMVNISTALAADRVWFNSGYHQTSFLNAVGELLVRMPDSNKLVDVESLLAKSRIVCPGIARPGRARGVTAEPPVILWAARWEYDKNPELFYEALMRLRERGVEFRLSVIGEQFSDSPVVFERMRNEFWGCIHRWGFQPTRDEYETALSEADLVVSTADHEFFGVSIVEAVASGAYPVLPDRLAYPELFGPKAADGSRGFLYDGTAEHLAAVLENRIGEACTGRLWLDPVLRGRGMVERFYWENKAAEMDDALKEIAGTTGDS